jgi:polyhydroxyalkanoate synthesis regulator phasin
MNGSAFTKPDLTTIDGILAAARPAERTIHLCIRGDLNAAIEDAQHELEDLLRGIRTKAEQAAPVDDEERPANPDDTLVDDDTEQAVADLTARIDDLRAQMRDNTVEFRFRRLPHSQYDALRKRFETAGEAVDMEALAIPLIAASCYSPAMTEEQAFQLAEDVFNRGQVGQLFNTAWETNQGTIVVPFSSAPSPAPRTRR